jgi:dTDP-4-dehydrorhamnose reductase
MADAPTAVVFGARGLLGSALCAALPRAGYRLGAAAGHADCDIADVGAVRALLARVRPDVVFNAAAYTDVERAEREPELAIRTNVDGPEILAHASRAVGATLVHYSTDFVFDGRLGRNYVEEDPPAPQGRYARTKVEGEARVAAVTPRHFILRVGNIYGRGGRNFPSTILRRLRAGETILADDERLASPTWVRDVAAVSIALAATEDYGLYHATAQGETTWAGFARFIAQLLGLPASRVDAVASSALPLSVPRPRRAILDNRRLRARGLDTFRAWQDGVRAYVAAETT